MEKKDIFMKHHHLIRILQQICHLHRFWIFFLKIPSFFRTFWEIFFQSHSTAILIWFCDRSFTVRTLDIFTHTGNIAKTLKKQCLFWVDDFPSLSWIWAENNKHKLLVVSKEEPWKIFRFLTNFVKFTPISQEGGTVPQVLGYRPETFWILTNPVGGKKLSGKSALKYTTPQAVLGGPWLEIASP